MLVITSTDGCRYTLVLVLLISVVIYIVKIRCGVGVADVTDYIDALVC